MSIIQVKAVSKRFGRQRILDEVSFTIDEPGIIALVGPNGSGKSTLLNCMVNLLDVDSGEIRLLGTDPKDVTVFNHVSYLKDNTVLYPYLTGWDHLAYAAKAYGLGKSRIKEVIQRIGIESYVHKKVGQYSLGMKQHLLLALAILNNPQLIIMDEPLNGLDPSSILKVRHLLKELEAKGTTILMSSHTLSEIDEVTNRILFLHNKQIRSEVLDSNVETAEQRYVELYEAGGVRE
jgi:ABC-2 type transport system ATP-binding protein